MFNMFVICLIIRVGKYNMNEIPQDRQYAFFFHREQQPTGDPFDGIPH